MKMVDDVTYIPRNINIVIGDSVPEYSRGALLDYLFSPDVPSRGAARHIFEMYKCFWAAFILLINTFIPNLVEEGCVKT